MHQENSIVIRADREKIFDTVSNLDNWPKLLPHYRWIRTLPASGGARIVNMAARRGWIPIRWTSRFEVDRPAWEIRFTHLKAFTKGMVVVWTFTPTAAGVLVRIRHDLVLGWPLIGKFVAEKIIGGFFIHHVASRTLAAFKKHLEQTVAQKTHMVAGRSRSP